LGAIIAAAGQRQLELVHWDREGSGIRERSIWQRVTSGNHPIARATSCLP
jgi:hypothetical protein